VKLIGTFIAACILMLGLLAWYIMVPRTQAPVSEPAATTRAIPQPQPETVARVSSEEARATVATSAAPAEAPTTQPTVRWATDPSAQDAQRRLERAQQILSDDPFHPEALRDKAAALADLRQWSPLADTLKRLVELNPNDVRLRYERAIVLMQLRQWLDVIAELKSVVAAQPEHARAWFNLAVAHQAVGHLGDARQAWDRVIELSPSTEALARRGEVLLDLQEWALAAADFGGVLASQPRAPDATLNLALALSKLGRDEEARARLIESLEEHPRHVPLLNRLAQLAYARCESAPDGNRTACDEAAEWCRRSLAIDGQQPEMQALLDAALSSSRR
jgi:tetratricopeptide (TPR) repeat protein